MKMNFTAFCVAIGSLSFLAAEQECACVKTYIHPNQMYFTDSSLLVNISDDVWIQPASLHTDGQGFYFVAVRYDERIPGPWQCPSCHTWNEEWRSYCKQSGCNRLRPSKS